MGALDMGRWTNYLKRHKSIIVGLSIGLLWMMLSNFVWAKELNQLKNIEIRSLHQSKIQVILEFSAPIVTPQSFSVEAPPAIVFVFPSVKNKLPKGSSNQKFTNSLLKKLNVVEAGNKTRMIIDVKKSLPFETDVNGNTLTITLGDGAPEQDDKVGKNLKSAGKEYQIKSFDFHRGDSGEARIVVNLSSPKAMIDYKEEEGKI